jgi:hypothetical protein
MTATANGLLATKDSGKCGMLVRTIDPGCQETDDPEGSSRGFSNWPPNLSAQACLSGIEILVQSCGLNPTDYTGSNVTASLFEHSPSL